MSCPINMKSLYVYSQGKIVVSNDSVQTFDDLPAGYYSVGFDEPKDYYFLNVEKPFTKQKVLYGNTSKLISRILSTYKDREHQTGVWLKGIKGSGKTMTAREMAIHCVEELNMPVIIINQAFVGADFHAFLVHLGSNVMFFFDEFEKVYHKAEDQESMLSFFDGGSQLKRLNVVTTNKDLNEHMHNRPGRFHYKIEHAGVDEDFIQEYCYDNLKNKGHINEVVDVANMFAIFTFDMLRSLVEEMNRFDERAKEAIKYLNIRPENSNVSYSAFIFKDNEQVKGYATECKFNPLSATAIRFTDWQICSVSGGSVFPPKLGTDDPDNDYVDDVTFCVKDAKINFTPDGISFVYELQGFRIDFVKTANTDFMSIL